MASTPPLRAYPGPDVNAAPKLLGITGALYIIALILFTGRIHIRTRNRRLGWDDFTLTFGLVTAPFKRLQITLLTAPIQILALVEWALLVVAVHYGAGRHNFYVPTRDHVPAQHFLVASELPWAASIMFIKISIAIMLLRMKHTPLWRVFLWLMIVVQILSCLASLIFQLVQCRPLAALWDPAGHPHAVCTDPDAAFVSLYVNSGIGITTDLIFALVPISFIRIMHRPLREKIVLSMLMGMGVFAAAASIVKTTLVKSYGRTGDTLWDAVDLTLWSILEEQTGIIAACIPCLKSPFERTLQKCGVLSTRKGSGYHPHAYHNRPRRIDSHQLPPLHLSFTRNVLNAGPAIAVDTNASSTFGKSSMGRSTNAHSEETIWPSGTDPSTMDYDQEESYRQMMAEGGILLTTEFQIKSEVLSRVGSRDGDEGVNARETERGREMEEWRVERPSCEGRARGWDPV